MQYKDTCLRYFTVILASLAMASCVTRTQPIKMCFPAKSEQAASIKRIAVVPFLGSDGLDATVKFESMLAEVNDQGRPYFTIVDRRTLENALAELKFQQTGMIDEKTAKKIGKLVGADGIYTGWADAPAAINKSYKTQHQECADTKKSGKFFSKCNTSQTVTVNCTDRAVQYTLTPRLISVQTGQVVYQRSVNKVGSDNFCGDDRIPSSEEVLRGQARTEVFSDVRQDVAPYCLDKTLTLKTDTDGLPPEARSSFSDALAFASSGRMDRSCEAWSLLESGNSASIALQYDLGICDEAAGRLEQALSRYTAADKLLTRPDDDINQALARVQGRIDDQAKLDAQTAVPTPALTPVTGQTSVGSRTGKRVPRN